MDFKNKYKEVMRRCAVPLIPSLEVQSLRSNTFYLNGYSAEASVLAKVCPLQKTDVTRYGVLVDALPGDIRSLASSLAILAAERAMEPIIVTQLEYCGFEQYGFRVERLPLDGVDELEIVLDELIGFWQIVFFVNIEEAGNFQ